MGDVEKPGKGGRAEHNLIESLKSRINELESFLEVSISLNKTLQFEKSIEVVLEKSLLFMKAEAGTIWLLSEDEEYLLPVVARGSKADLLKGLRLRYGEGLAGQVVKSKEPVLINDVRKDGRWARRFDDTTGFVTRTMLAVPLLLEEGEPIGCLQLVNKKDGMMFTSDDLRICLELCRYTAQIIENSRRFSHQSIFLDSLLKNLVSAIDSRDSHNKGHSERVSRYSKIIGEKLGMSSSKLEILEKAALLHDVGKVCIPDQILLQTVSLGSDKLDLIKKYPVIGAQIIYQVEPHYMAKQIWEGILYHCEKFDGTGYPTGLKGDEIPLFARIIAIADYFDNLTVDRLYYKGKRKEEAISELKRLSGTHFDPALVDIFTDAVECISSTFNNTGDKAL